MIIKHVYIDALAHIKQLEIEEIDKSGTTRFWMISKEDWLKQGYQADNITITDEGFKVKRKWYNNRIIRSIDSKEKILNYEYRVIKVYCEESGYNMHITVTGIEILCPNDDAVEELKKLGGIVRENSKYTVYFESLQLVKLMINSADIRSFTFRNNINLDGAYTVYIEVKKIEEIKSRGIKLVEDVTYKNNFNSWLNKATVLGLADYYNIEKGYTLNDMPICKEETLIFPKVRRLDRLLIAVLNPNIKEIIVPDTVRSVMCDFSYFENLEKLIIGDNAVVLYASSLIGLHKLKELDLNNVIDIPSLDGLNLKRLRIRIDAKLEWTGINNVKTLKEIEFIEGE